MPYFNVKYKKLITYLKDAHIATLIDQEQDFLNGDDGSVLEIEYQLWAFIEFGYPNYKLNKLREKFEREFAHNRLVADFKIDTFCEEAFSDLNELKNKFRSIPICGLAIKIRTDFKAEYLDYLENEYSDTSVDTNNIIYHKLLLTENRYVDLPEQILKKISRYFSFQEKFIDELLKLMKSKSNPIKKGKKYGTTYCYDYFKFDSSKFSNASEEIINDFFFGLIQKKFVENESLLHLQNFFSNKSSQKRVKWLSTKQDLYYLIRVLISKQFIINPKRMRKYIISKIFLKSDGSELLPKELEDIQTPANTSVLDSIIRNLE